MVLAEVIGANCVFKDFTSKTIFKLAKRYALDFSYVRAVTIAIEADSGTNRIVIGDYRVSEYIDAFAQLNRLIVNFTPADLASRQLVVSFKKMHCFQHIQFLFRNNELNIMVSMRSCNLKEKFLTDLYLSYYMGLKLLKKVHSCNPNAEYMRINIHFNAGSLHILGNGVMSC